ncbi:MAG: poly-gamma-glutamate biosynthesis protein PgsC [Candidatus Aminicenantes bacterium RBG_13_62_12]|jgi:poly-gamma-glutamate biosynthesis protein PgsC/CapC|nr:MAG: poly-gamma-glutamate biosynthesis protein PgsC [Candidatus Aminicenantes bacterium RBG_13_62_12]
MPFETVFIGLAVALLYIEATGIYPGGIIVPAFLAASLDQPLRAAATIVVACMSLLLYKLLARYFILFGRRRFVILLFLGALISQIFAWAVPNLPAGPAELRVIGFIIPGLLAGNLERQKFLPTLASLATVTTVTYFLAGFIRMVF